MILASSPLLICAGSYIIYSALGVGPRCIQVSLPDGFGTRLRPPDAYAHFSQHGAVAGVQVQAHAGIFADSARSPIRQLITQASSRWPWLAG